MPFLRKAVAGAGVDGLARVTTFWDDACFCGRLQDPPFAASQLTRRILRLALRASFAVRSDLLSPQSNSLSPVPSSQFPTPRHSTIRCFPYRAFGQFALQGAAMQAEAAGGFGDAALALGENALDVFPLQAFQRRRCVGQTADSVRVCSRVAEQLGFGKSETLECFVP